MAKFCTQCGASLPDETRFCTECGALTDAVDTTAPTVEETPPVPPPPPVEPPKSAPPAPPQQPRQTAYHSQPAQPVYQQPVYQAPPAPAPVQGDPDRPAKGSKYEPISTGGFIGIFLLLCIPVIGLILMIVWACGGCRKVTKRALARAMLIFTAIMLVISLVLGFAAKSFINNILEEAGISTSQSGKSSKDSKSSGLLGGLLGGSDEPASDDPFSGLGALAGLMGGGQSGSSDLDDLAGLLGALGALEGMTGEEGSGDWEGILGTIEDANGQAAAVSDGWPKSLRPYPGGTATSVESYRTEISGTTLEEMMEWIDDLRKDGFEYQDFYDFGFAEEDMLGMNGWWAYDGKTYLSASYSEGVVTVDHTSELPDYGF